MCGKYRELLNKLIKLKKNILLIELPILAKLFEQNKEHLEFIHEMNAFLRSFDGLNKIKVLQVNDLLFKNGNVMEELYEKEIVLGNRVLVDKIHLNKKGLELVKNRIVEFIMEKRKFMLSTKASADEVLVNHNHLLGNKEMRDELLCEDNFNNPVNNKVGALLPYIELRIGQEMVKCLVDSGSQATLISHDVYDKIKETANVNIPELPVTNVSIQGVTGVKSKKINKQVYLPCKIDEFAFDMPCFVIRDIPITIILGCDFLEEHKANLDFENRFLRLSHDRKVIKIKLIEEAESSKVYGIKVICCNYLRTKDSIDQLVYVENQLRDTNILINSINQDESLQFRTVNLEQDDKIGNLLEEIAERNPEVSDRDLSRLNDILNENKSVFSDKPGLIRGFEAKINLTNPDPFVGKSYPIPFNKRREVQQEINNLIKNDILEKSDSPYNNSLVAVTKKDGSTRICIDSRRINRYIVGDCERTEKIEVILQRFAGTKYMTSIDLTQGFLQVKLNKDSRKYVSFVFQGMNLAYKRLPFGLKTSSAIFIKAMSHIFKSDFDHFLICYVDDLIIFSPTLNEHLTHIQLILNRLREYGATVKLSKSQFLRSEVNFLGYIISTEGIKMDPEKVEKIANVKEPRNLKELQSILGMMNYYRCFHKKFSELTSGFGHLLSNKNKWKWGKHESELFVRLKKEFLKSVVLTHPDFDKEFYIGTDASDLAVAATLSQRGNDGELRVIMFASRKLMEAEKAYSITEKELLAIIFACNKFRAYLIGHPKVIVQTDHKALTFLTNCRLTHGRLLRWVLILQEFNLDIQFIPGKENVVCDLLSRINDEGIENKDKNLLKVMKSRIKLDYTDRELKEIIKDLKECQLNDTRLGEIYRAIEDDRNDVQNLKRTFCLHDGLLFQNSKDDDENWRVCIPQNKIHSLVDFTHRKYGHFGGHKIYLILREFCVFKQMEKVIKGQLKKCEVCQKTKHSNQRQVGNLLSVTAEEPLQLVSIDLIGELPSSEFGTRHILSMVDIFSKYVKLYAIRTANTVTILRKIQNYEQNIGKIQCILSDHGTQFTSKKWYSGLDELDIKYIHSSVYSPQCNPIERYNREINRLCRLYCSEKHTKWAEYLPQVEYCLNYSINSVTEQAPYTLMFGKKCEGILDKLLSFPAKQYDHDKIVILTRERVKNKLQKRKTNFNKKIKAMSFEVGNKVLVRTHYLSDKLGKKIKKYFQLYEGPYVVTKIKCENAYEVEDPITGKIRGVYNVRQLKKFHE